jgi:hypothetical protein
MRARPFRCLIGWHAWQMVAVDNLTQRVTLECSRCGVDRERQTSDADRGRPGGDDPFFNTPRQGP